MGVIEPVDQVHMAGTAATCTTGQVAVKLGFCSGSKSSGFFVTYVNPLNPAVFADSIVNLI
mgnify:CR=1 FL=1